MLKKNEKNEFLDVIEFLNDAIILIKKNDKKIKFVNYRFEELFNISKKNLIGKSIKFFFKESSTILDYINKSILKKNLSSMPTTIDEEIKINIFFRVDLSFSTQILNASMDIINKIEYENIIIVMRLNKKNNFYDLAFDNKFQFFNDFITKLIEFIISPISNIKGSAQLLQKIESKNSEFYEIIIKEVDKLVNFINLFEDKSINLKKTKIKFNIHEIIRAAIKNINNLIINKIDLIENFDPSLPNISTDKNQLIILFENLIRNALESISPEGGYIKISTFFYFGEVKNIPNTKKNKSSNFILIEIEDNGDGIKEEFKDQIFLPFFSTKNKKGLGLYQAKKIALENNCEIQFYSKKNITTFKIWIPL